MKLAVITTAVLLAAATGQACAQSPTAATAEVQRLLQGAANPADFADVSSGGLVSVKHKPSGVVCQFGTGSPDDSLHAGPSGMMCAAATAYEIDSLDVFRAPNASEADIQGGFERAMGQVANPRPMNGFTTLQSDKPGAPPHVARRFAGTIGGGTPVFVRMAYAQVGDWLIMQRVLTALNAAQTADNDAERRLLAAIDQAAAQQAAGKGAKKAP